MSAAAATANQSPPTTHNQPPQQSAIDAVNLSRMRTSQDEFQSAQGAMRSIFGKAEAQGIHLKAAKKALSIVKSGDVDAWLQETSKVTAYLKILRHGVTESQLSLELESTLAPIEEKATLDGRSAGLAGEPESNNPHHLNTKAGQSWVAAHRQGFAERELVLSMKDDAAEGDDVSAEDDED